MKREEQIDIISDKYAHNIVMQRKEYPCLPLSKRMELIKFDGYEIAQAFEDAMRYADAHPNWISVEDELPPKNSEYGALSNNVLATDGKEIYESVYNHDFGEWFTHDLWAINNITHWMPLPSIEHLKEKEL